MNGDAAGPPAFDWAFTARVLALALRQGLEDAGRTGYVVGLSGGADSAVAAALAVRAVGPAAVHALFLPAPGTPDEARLGAEAVAAALGLTVETVPLEALLAAAPLPPGDRIRRGNLIARFRMALLYDRAAESDALVLGTSNKSEIALGYSTLWGDLAADCWPLGDLYKTQVLALGRMLGLPAAVVERRPSAELWEGQTDEDEMGFSYSAADRVLYTYLEQRRRPAEIVASGVDADLVERVLARVRSNSFKRRLPRIPKLTARTVGHDFLHPRAWRAPA